MPYALLSFAAVVIFILVHLFAKQTQKLNVVTHGRFLSFCGGIAIAYVFIDILPKLAENDIIIQKILKGIFPYVERHIYVMALTGFLVFFSISRSKELLGGRASYFVSLGSYALFNFLVAYAVSDENNPEVKPLVLFTFALALHYFTNDYTLNKEHGSSYGVFEKGLLVISLLLGWLVGYLFVLPEVGVAMVSAFIGGGVILNVTRHELPDETPHSLGSFIFAAVFYTILLLVIGER